MTSLRPSSPLPPPVHPSLRRRNDASNSELFGSTSSPNTSQLLSPSPRPLRPSSSPTTSSSISSSAETSSDTDTAKESHSVAEETLTEAQLRQVYDEEEVDYFLKLFSDVCTIHIDLSLPFHRLLVVCTRGQDIPLAIFHRRRQFSRCHIYPGARCGVRRR